jgi:hypothetical protein
MSAKKVRKPAEQSIYLCFALPHDQTAAIKRFAERFGQQPKKIFTDKRVLWLGPIPRK